MRLAIVLNEAESRAHHARQAQVPEMLDPDPEPRELAELIAERVANSQRTPIGEEPAVVDLYETLPGPAHEPPRTP